MDRSEKEDLPALKRLNFDEEKIADVVDGINHDLIKLEDPWEKPCSPRELDEGLELYNNQPIGVIGVILIETGCAHA